MKKLGRHVFQISFCAAAIVACLALLQTEAVYAQKGPQQVTVTNSDAQPVPVKQSGVWNVGINSSDANPIVVRNTGSQPKQAFNDTISLNHTSGSNFATVLGLTVPDGKQLVITYASVDSNLPVGQKPFLSFIIQPPVGIESPRHYLTAGQLGTLPTNEDLYAAGQKMELYLDPGTAVHFVFLRNSFTGEAFARFQICGYLVDVPAQAQ